MSQGPFLQDTWLNSPSLAGGARSPFSRVRVQVKTPFRPSLLNPNAVLTGAFILASTTARTSNSLLGWNSAYSFTSNVMYGILYAVTPELFPTRDRGTGNALTATANRVFGVIVRLHFCVRSRGGIEICHGFFGSQAPIIALYTNLTTAVPIFIAGAILLAAGFIALLLPYESRGKASL